MSLMALGGLFVASGLHGVLPERLPAGSKMLVAAFGAFAVSAVATAGLRRDAFFLFIGLSLLSLNWTAVLHILFTVFGRKPLNGWSAVSLAVVALWAIFHIWRRRTRFVPDTEAR